MPGSKPYPMQLLHATADITSGKAPRSKVGSFCFLGVSAGKQVGLLHASISRHDERTLRTGLPRGTRAHHPVLLSRGLNRETATDVAQAAWARGWERLDQLRDESVLVTWVNTIALNQFRRSLRHDSRYEALVDVPHPQPPMNWAAIDLQRILSRCRERDRLLLKAQLEGLTAKELSERTGGSATDDAPSPFPRPKCRQDGRAGWSPRPKRCNYRVQREPGTLWRSI